MTLPKFSGKYSGTAKVDLCALFCKNLTDTSEKFQLLENFSSSWPICFWTANTSEGLEILRIGDEN